MGDLLFSFDGRTKRIPYLFAILCIVAVAMGVIALQQRLGDWKYAGIFVMTASVLPVLIYFAATAKRFEDRGRFSLVGFFLYYIIPGAIIFGAQAVLGEPIINPETVAADLQALRTASDLSQNDLIRWGALGVAALIFLVGQISLFLMGSKKDAMSADTSKETVNGAA